MSNPEEVIEPESDSGGKIWTEAMASAEPFRPKVEQDSASRTACKERGEKVLQSTDEYKITQAGSVSEFVKQVGRLPNWYEQHELQYGPKEQQVPGIMRGYFFEGETDSSPDDRATERLHLRSLRGIEKLEWDIEKIYGGREDERNVDYYDIVDKYKEAIEQYGPDVESTGVVPVYNLIRILSWTRNNEAITITDESRTFGFVPPEALVKSQERILEGLEDAHSRYFSDQTPEDKKHAMTAILGKLQFKDDLARRTGTFLDAESYEHPEEHNLPPEIGHYTFKLSDTELDLLANAEDDDILANGIKRILPQHIQVEILRRIPYKESNELVLSSIRKNQELAAETQTDEEYSRTFSQIYELEWLLTGFNSVDKAKEALREAESKIEELGEASGSLRSIFRDLRRETEAMANSIGVYRDKNLSRLMRGIKVWSNPNDIDGTEDRILEAITHFGPLDLAVKEQREEALNETHKEQAVRDGNF